MTSIVALLLSIGSLAVTLILHHLDNTSRLRLTFVPDYELIRVKFTPTMSAKYPVSYLRHVKIFCQNEGPVPLTLTDIEIYVADPKRMPNVSTRSVEGPLQIDNEASLLLTPTFFENGKPLSFPVVLHGRELRIIEVNLNVGVARTEWSTLAGKVPVNSEVVYEELRHLPEATNLYFFGATDATYRVYLAWFHKDLGKQVDATFDLLGDLRQTGGE